MTAMELCTDLRQCGAVLTPLVDHVRIDAPPGVPCPAFLRDLLDLLEEYEERVAIMEECGGRAREDAEQRAWQYLCDHADLPVAPALV